MSVFLPVNSILETMGDTYKLGFAKFYNDSMKNRRSFICRNIPQCVDCFKMFDIRTIPIENGCDLRFKQKNHSIIFCKFEEFYCFQPVCLYISNFIELTIVNSKLHSYDMSSGVVNSFHMRHKNRIIYFDKCFICYSHSIKLFT